MQPRHGYEASQSNDINLARKIMWLIPDSLWPRSFLRQEKDRIAPFIWAPSGRICLLRMAGLLPAASRHFKYLQVSGSRSKTIPLIVALLSAKSRDDDNKQTQQPRTQVCVGWTNGESVSPNPETRARFQKNPTKKVWSGKSQKLQRRCCNHLPKMSSPTPLCPGSSWDYAHLPDQPKHLRSVSHWPP